MKKIVEIFNNIIKAMGLVFGDIGTSPIYTFTVIFITLQPTFQNITGILSLIIWTLLLVVSLQYVFLAMSLSKQGEGGTIVLSVILKKLLKSSRSILFFSFLSYIGISLLIGDSVITPAISILSAVEGLHLIPNIGHIPQALIIIITLMITIALFSIQNHGTEKISRIFGPVMLLWFIALGLSGLCSLIFMPKVLISFNPVCAINFLLHHGLAGFFVLSEVVLCATGAEALYADMGHLGRKPIIHAWFIVCTVLLLNYLGQGAFLLAHPEAKNILFAMILSQSHFLYIPFLLLSILATIIASQAMISGLFSIVYQGINTHIFPLFRVNYTSKDINSQIYIGTANWFLLFFVILVIILFKKSEHLASAYGLAVTGTITITAIMMSVIFFLRKKYLPLVLSLFLLVIDLIFLISTSVKIPTGAYWSIIISMIPFALILIYTNGHKMLFRSMHLMDKHIFIEKYNKIYPNVCKIKGTALFFIRGMEKLPPYIVKTFFDNNIIYTDNLFVHINKLPEAYGINYKIIPVEKGLRVLQINTGYMEVLNISEILNKLEIKEKVIFYGVEEIQTTNPIWKIFSFIKRNTPTFVSFYEIPTHKIHGVITRIDAKI